MYSKCVPLQGCKMNKQFSEGNKKPPQTRKMFTYMYVTGYFAARSLVIFLPASLQLYVCFEKWYLSSKSFKIFHEPNASSEVLQKMPQRFRVHATHILDCGFVQIDDPFDGFVKIADLKDPAAELFVSGGSAEISVRNDSTTLA